LEGKDKRAKEKMADVERNKKGAICLVTLVVAVIPGLFA